MPYLELWTSACLRTFLQRAQCCWEGWMPCTSAPRLPPDNLEEHEERLFESDSDGLTKRQKEQEGKETVLFRCLTWLEQEDLVILAQLHEPWDALGELHHILDCMGDLDGTLLPQHVPGLEPNTHSLWVIYSVLKVVTVMSAITVKTPEKQTYCDTVSVMFCTWGRHHSRNSHLALVHLDLFIGVCLPG